MFETLSYLIEIVLAYIHNSRHGVLIQKLCWWFSRRWVYYGVMLICHPEHYILTIDILFKLWVATLCQFSRYYHLQQNKEPVLFVICECISFVKRNINFPNIRPVVYDTVMP
jgi:hypothetical protein